MPATTKDGAMETAEETMTVELGPCHYCSSCGLIDTANRAMDSYTSHLWNLLTNPLVWAFVELSEDTDKLDTTFQQWRRDSDYSYDYNVRPFVRLVELFTDEQCCECRNCRSVVWADEVQSVYGDTVCRSCIDNYYEWCENCEEYCTGTTFIGGTSYCSECRDRHCRWCGVCDEYYLRDDDEDHDHRHGCDCVAPVMSFKFPADGIGFVANDERLTVNLPKGMIDDAGISRIRRMLYDTMGLSLGNVTETLEGIGPMWQTKQGNFTRRLSSAFYKGQGVKLPSALISEIGNMARAHSSDEATWQVEFTRDLNQSADCFYHENSCWWGSGGYGISKCSFKNWGGIGLRSYDDEEMASYRPNGRAWVMPLNDELLPTHSPSSHAYVIFNGYGELEGYIPARIVAHLTGKSYRKVSLVIPAGDSYIMYVNNDAGYLVADEATCEKTSGLRFSFDPHDTRDVREEVMA